MSTLMRLKGRLMDRVRVLKAVGSGAADALAHFGAYVRNAARWSIRKAKGPHDTARPGQPPKSHLGVLRNLIIFDAGPTSVAIGPVPMNQKGSGDVPGLLEKGGVVTRATKGGKARTLHYRGNPYMVPAYEKGLAQLPKFWRESVH